jgi:DNA relaxase NicK
MLPVAKVTTSLISMCSTCHSHFVSGSQRASTDAWHQRNTRNKNKTKDQWGCFFLTMFTCNKLSQYNVEILKFLNKRNLLRNEDLVYQSILQILVLNTVKNKEKQVYM